MNIPRYVRRLRFQKDLAKVRRGTKSISIEGDVKNAECLKDSFALREVYLVTTTQEQFEKIIPHLKHIIHLKMYNIRCTDLSALGTLTALEELDLEWNTKIEKLWNMSKLTALRSLRISDFSKLHDITTMADMPWITDLELSGGIWNKLSLATIEPLARLTNLKRLNLGNIEIKDKTSILPLRKLKTLEQLTIPMRFPTEEIARLSVELPNTKCDVFYPYVKVDLGDGKDIMIVGKGKPRLNSKKDAKRIEKYVHEFKIFQERYTQQTK